MKRVATAVEITLVLLLTGCDITFPTPTESEVVGRWEYSPDLGYDSTNPDGWIEFADDGTFRMDEIPNDILFAQPETISSRSMPLEGTWSIGTGSPYDNGPYVELAVDRELSPELPSTSATSIDFDLRGFADDRSYGEARTLYIFIGDPDNVDRYSLARVDSD